MNDNNIGNARRAYSKSNNVKFTQEDAAKHFGVSVGTYRNWEQGRVDLNAAQIGEIADFYGVSSDYLLKMEKSLANGTVLSIGEKELVEAFRSVEPWAKELILNQARSLSLHAKGAGK